MTIEGMMLPAFIYDAWIVLFPSFEHPNAYSKLLPNMKGADAYFREFIFPRKPEAKIRSVSWMDHVLVRPDVLTAEIDETIREHWIFLEKDPYPHRFIPVSHEQYKNLAHGYGNEFISVDIDLRSNSGTGP